MRAVVHRKPFEVVVEEVPDPQIEYPNEVIVRIASTAICGSDLPMHEGRTAAKPGLVFGDENLGTVEEVDSGATALTVGERAMMPFNVPCGFCKNCVSGYAGFCLTVNPCFAGGAYGYVAMGPYPGSEHDADYILLAGIGSRVVAEGGGDISQGKAYIAVPWTCPSRTCPRRASLVSPFWHSSGQRVDPHYLS